MAELGVLFEAAAAVVLQPSRLNDADPRVRGLLQALQFPVSPEPGPQDHQRARLLRAAAGFVRVFRLDSTVAPGLCCFGAEVDPAVLAGEPGLPVIGVVGTGLTPLDAFCSCVGEGIERISTIETAEDLARCVPPPAQPDAWLRPMLDAATRAPEWLVAHGLDGAPDMALPVDLCLRRPAERQAFRPPWPLSVGCAAGATRDAALLHGLFELIERDAVALWWRGGMFGRPVALDEPAARETAELLAALRQGRSDRRTWLLDIGTDVGVPVMAAVSFAPDGGGFCFGTAARATRAAAARSAVFELMQLEMAIEVVAAKRRERGDAGLNAMDHAHLERFGGINAARCALVHPTGAPRENNELAATSDEDALQAVLSRLHANNFRACAIDLTRPRFDVPVWRVVCPELQVDPSWIVGPRLAAAVADTGGGDCHTGGIALM